MTDKAERQIQFEALLETHRRIVFKVARIYCRSPQDRDDLVQEILGQLWRSFASYDSARSFSTWMYRVAINVAISFGRGLPRRSMVSLEEAAIDPVDPGDDSAEGALERGEMYRLIDQLPPLNRALLLLYIEDRSYAEIAEILGITQTNVATKISRLKQELRDAVNSNNP